MACPGCGLSRGILELLGGHWRAALADHAFAPFFLAALGLVGMAGMLPDRPRRSLAGAIGRFERNSGAAVIGALALLGYWGARLH